MELKVQNNDIDIALSTINSLTLDMLDEKKQLERILNFFLAQNEDEDGFFIASGAAANSVQGIYTKIEEIFKIVAKDIDFCVPTGEAWHKSLLNQMRSENKKRTPFISQALYKKLNNLRSFRHVVCHSYGSQLDGNIIIDRAKLCLDAIEHLVCDINDFSNKLNDNDLHTFSHAPSQH